MPTPAWAAAKVLPKVVGSLGALVILAVWLVAGVVLCVLGARRARAAQDAALEAELAELELELDADGEPATA